MKTKYSDEETDVCNIVCTAIQRGWREFAKNRKLLDEPHPDWAMCATLIALDTISKLAQANLDVLNRIEENDERLGGA